MKNINALLGGIGGSVLGATIALAISATAIDRPSLDGRISVDSTPPARSANHPMSGYADIVEKVSPSVVSVFSTRKAESVSMTGSDPRGESPFRRFFEDRDLEKFFRGQPDRGQPHGNSDPRRQPMPKQRGQGSGVILSSDGYVLTNAHVVKDADEIKIALGDVEKEYEAVVVGSDPQSDLAVLKIEAKDLHAATLGDSAQLRVGDAVLAVGNPFGLTKTVTSGIVSAVGRNNLNIAGYENFIQTDASINPGNSGGALIDNRGRVVGINTAIFSRTGGNVGIGFAIPVNMALDIANDLIADGKVDRGYLGVMLGPLTSDLAKALGVEDRGVLVNQVLPDTPAATAGFKDGDVIVSLDGKSVSDLSNLRFRVGGLEPGEKARFGIHRDGKDMDLEVQIGRLDSDTLASVTGKSTAPDSPDVKFIDGVRVAELNSETRERYQVSSDYEKGLIVADVDPGSTAAEAGLRPGDLILEVSQEPVDSVRSAMNAKKKAKNNMLLLRVASAEGTRFLAVDMS